MIELKIKGGRSRAQLGVLTLREKLTVEYAKDLKEGLLKALENTTRLEINMENMSEIDLTCLQLLCSANRSFKAVDKEIAFAGEPPDLFKQALIEAGLYRTGRPAPESENDCFRISGLSL